MDALAPKAAGTEHGTWRALPGVGWHMEGHHGARWLPEQGGATLARSGAPGSGRLLGLPHEHGAEGQPWSESCSQPFMHCLQSKCLVQTRSSIGKQEKKGNSITLRGSGSRELRWVRRAGLGGQAETEGKPAAVAIATCSLISVR